MEGKCQSWWGATTLCLQRAGSVPLCHVPQDFLLKWTQITWINSFYRTVLAVLLFFWSSCPTSWHPGKTQTKGLSTAGKQNLSPLFPYSSRQCNKEQVCDVLAHSAGGFQSQKIKQTWQQTLNCLLSTRHTVSVKQLKGVVFYDAYIM